MVRRMGGPGRREEEVEETYLAPRSLEKVTWERTIYIERDIVMNKNSFWKYETIIKFATLKKCIHYLHP